MNTKISKKKIKKENGNKKRKPKNGKGFLNKIINKLPFEAHLPGYQYCGPGTHLEKRLNRNDPGINDLDKACKEHDIAYSNTNNMEERHQADKILGNRAWKRFKSLNSGIRERMDALGVAGIMKTKQKLGMGLKTKKGSCIKKKSECKKPKKTKTKPQKKSSVSKVFKNAMSTAKFTLHTKQPKTVPEAAKVAIQAAKTIVKKHNLTEKDIKHGLPRIIPVPKKMGGVLPLIPIFAGLSALGALAGGSAGVANAVISANNAKRNFNEAQRHNQMIEAISLGKSGSGLFLSPYKKGLGLFLGPDPKNV